LNHTSRFRMFPFAAAAIGRFNRAQLAVIVITNQSGVSRGYFPESLVKTVNELMIQELARTGAHVDGVYYCPHRSADRCECRKPKPGLIMEAARQHALDLRRSFVVGDRYSDIELARGVGSRAVLVRTGYGEGELAWHAAQWSSPPDFVAADLSAAAEWIVEQTA